MSSPPFRQCGADWVMLVSVGCWISNPEHENQNNSRSNQSIHEKPVSQTENSTPRPSKCTDRDVIQYA